MDALQEQVKMAADTDKTAEIERLRAWLSEIADCDLRNQPAAFNIREEDWAKRHILMLQQMARDALVGKTPGNG